MPSASRVVALVAAVLSGTALAGLAQGQAQGPSPAQVPTGADGNPTITVTGKRLPAAEAPRSSTCAVLVRDPGFRSLLKYSSENGLLGPAIFVPTRLPRNPDYAAAPVVPAGSPLPDIPKARFGVSARAIDGAIGPGAVDEGTLPSASLLPEGTVGDTTSPDDLAAAQALCRTAYSRGTGAPALAGGADADRDPRGAFAVLEQKDAQFARGRAEIAYRDTSLPTAFALFDQRRYGEALTWFRKAESKLPYTDGGDEAALFIGKLYLQGLGAQSDPAEGVKWLKKAATAAFNPTLETPIFDPREPDRNTAVGEAAVILANVYRTGFKGIAKDPAEARKWYDRAFDVGHVPAAKTLGDLYYDGIDTPRDVAKALTYYKRGAKLNDPAAQVALGDILYRGEDGIARDMKTALGWYQAAAKSQDPAALRALALAYDSGQGVKADPQAAIGFYKTAALKGDVAARTALGTYFYEGTVVPKDLPTARRWFEQAAAGSDADGTFDLAAMMARGEGGPKDVVKAWALMKRAAALGHQNAPLALAALERRMTPAERQATLAGAAGR